MGDHLLSALKTDVLVVGAGAAGLTAAIAAGRNRAGVLLVDCQGYVGGLSASLPWLGFHDREYRQTVKGLAGQFVRQLQEMGAASEYCHDPKCGSAVSIDGHTWKCVAMDGLRESGVKVMLHTHVVDTLREGDRITGVVTEHKSGRQDILAKVVIDCSGDGDVAARGGALWEKGRTGDGLVQSPSLAVRIGGVDRVEFLRGVRDKQNGYREWLLPYPDLWAKMMGRLDDKPVLLVGGYASLVEKARAAGDLKIPQTRIVGVKLHRPDQFLTVMNRVLGLDPTSTASVSEAYAHTYRQVPETVQFFRKYVPGFDNAHLLEIAPMLGVRESRRILGEYVLTKEDLIQGRQFDDSVGAGGYHIDIHRPSGTWVESYNVQAYTIPLRCLIARGVEGLMMAGKCVSATHEAVASTRVIPICMAQGEAAGTAAALAVRPGADLRDLDPEHVRESLRSQGAEIGESLGDPNHEVIDQIGQLPLEEAVEGGGDDEVASQEDSWIR